MDGFNIPRIKAMNQFKAISALLKESDDEDDFVAFDDELPKRSELKPSKSQLHIRKMPSSFAISKKFKKQKTTQKTKGRTP